MERIYNKYKGLEINECFVCGYASAQLITCSKKAQPASFKRKEKTMFIDESIAEKGDYLTYIDESTLDKITSNRVDGY